MLSAHGGWVKRVNAGHVDSACEVLPQQCKMFNTNLFPIGDTFYLYI